MRELLADSTLLSLEGNADYGPIERPSHKSDWDAPDLKKRHDSFFPPTPQLSPTHSGDKPRELSSGNPIGVGLRIKLIVC